MTTDSAMRFFHSRAEALGPEDFETASIRSAAPSYVSEAPSYHSTVPTAEITPPYTPPAVNTASAAAAAPATADAELSRSRTPQPLPRPQPQPHHAPSVGLPPLPPLASRAAALPTLSEFRIPTWSTISANPTARHYHNVAQRRLARGGGDADPAESLRQLVLRQAIEHEEDLRTRQFRPLEDPYLVGEVAARHARAERLARESGDDVLLREDRRWDMLLSEMRDWSTRERGWTRVRREAETQRPKLAGRLGGRLML